MFTRSAAALALSLLATEASAQVLGSPYFPQTLNSGTVVGRLSSGPGPTEAIPMSSLLTALFPSGPTATTWQAGSVVYNGSVSGQVTTQGQAAAGTYTLQWPSTVGATNSCLSESVSGSIATLSFTPCALLGSNNVFTGNNTFSGTVTANSTISASDVVTSSVNTNTGTGSSFQLQAINASSTGGRGGVGIQNSNGGGSWSLQQDNTGLAIVQNSGTANSISWFDKAGNNYLNFTGGAALANTNVAVNSTKASSSTTTGALTVAGGVGIGGALNVGGAFSLGGTTETFPASGNLVGTTDTQTLTNKSIAGSEINSGTVPAAQGGAGTINGVLSGNGSGVVSQGATTGLSDVVSAGSWTPADGSGASLTFTGVQSSYTKIGNMVFAYAALTYPSTANGSNATISGFPVNFPNTNYARGGCMAYGNGGVNIAKLLPNANAATAVILSNTNANLTNANMSTLTIIFMCTYPAS